MEIIIRWKFYASCYYFQGEACTAIVRPDPSNTEFGIEAQVYDVPLSDNDLFSLFDNAKCSKEPFLHAHFTHTPFDPINRNKVIGQAKARAEKEIRVREYNFKSFKSKKEEKLLSDYGVSMTSSVPHV